LENRATTQDGVRRLLNGSWLPTRPVRLKYLTFFSIALFQLILTHINKTGLEHAFAFFLLVCAT
jgi:hypothetical protein